MKARIELSHRSIVVWNDEQNETIDVDPYYYYNNHLEKNLPEVSRGEFHKIKCDGDIFYETEIPFILREGDKIKCIFCCGVIIFSNYDIDKDEILLIVEED